MFIFTLVALLIVLIFMKIIVTILQTKCGSKVCLVGKTALVTGGNSGIGYQIVLALAQRGCKIIIADKIQDDKLLENIYKETGSRNVEFKQMDLSSFKSIREFADNIKNDEDKLDILINNAGIGRCVPEITEDGLDLVMQVNYFGAFLLTRLLEGLLKKNGGRIVFTGSLLSYFHKFSLDVLKNTGAETSTYSYHNSKLCLLMVSNIFAENLKKYGVTSNCYHPGAAITGIFKSSLQIGDKICVNWFLIKFFELWTFLFGKTAEEAAQTAIHLACANEVKDVTGEFFFESKLTWKPSLVSDKNLCKALWEATEKIVRLKQE